SSVFIHVLSLHDALPICSSGQTGAFYILNDLGVGSIATGTTAFDIYFGASPNLLSSIRITVDNGYNAYLNGTLLGSGNDWGSARSEEHTSELQSRENLVC